MSIPTFIDINEIEQCQDLREYFVSLGAQINEKTSTDSYMTELGEIISVCDVIFTQDLDKDKERNVEQDIEAVLNSIVSVLIQVPHTTPFCSQLINAFCDKMVKAPNPKLALIALRVLQNLFGGLGENPHLRYRVYFSMVHLSGQTGMVQQVFNDINKLKNWFTPKDISNERIQILLRLLHEVLLNQKQSELASKVMIELLSTYTEENASQAREDAHKCIVSFLADPNTFLMDHLLSLKPVKFLEGELIHDLLTIFVAEKLTSYIKFYNAHKDFVESLGLSHEQNLQKMRLLTFMQMAENRKEIPFEAIQTELQLNPDQVEGFVIDVLRTKLVKAKVDQLNRRVLVSSTMHRTFGRQQWMQLRETLLKWHQNLGHVQHTIQAAVRSYDTMGQS